MKGPIPEEGFQPKQRAKYKDRLSRFVVAFWFEKHCPSKFIAVKDQGFYSTCVCGKCNAIAREVWVPDPAEENLKKYRAEVMKANHEVWFRKIQGPLGIVEVCVIKQVTADFIGS